METTMNYCLSCDRIIENMRGLAAIHILSRSGESPLGPMMCESRRRLLEITVRDAFAECVSSSGIHVTDLDIDGLKLSLAVGRGFGTEHLLLVSRVLEQTVAAVAMAMWCSLSGLEKEEAVFRSLADGWRKKLRSLLSPPPCLRPSWP